MTYPFSKIETPTHESITVFVDGEVHVAVSDHPNYESIVEAAKSGDPGIVDLFDLSRNVAQRFDSLSRRVSVGGGTLYFDNEPVHGAVAEHVVRFYREGLDFGPLVNFLEKMAANPNEHSRQQSYDWLEGRNFTIRADGTIVAYKGVIKGTDEDGNVTYRSISSGSAIVDGETKTGQIPNYVGAVVEMPRSKVQFDPSVGCSYGLHAGTWEYARDFARGAVLKVAIDPADIVSVPTDCNSQKVRVSRYTVLEVIDRPVTTPLDYDEDELDDWGFEEGFPRLSSAPGDPVDVDDLDQGDYVVQVGAHGPGQPGEEFRFSHVSNGFIVLEGSDGEWLPRRFVYA